LDHNASAARRSLWQHNTLTGIEMLSVEVGRAPSLPRSQDGGRQLFK